MPKKPKKPPLTKRQQEQLDYAKWEASVNSMKTGFAREKHAATKDVLVYKLTTPPGRPLVAHNSRFTAGGSTAKAPDKFYTGTKMLGIGVLHKSNSVPVFAEDDAKDIARMRR